MVDILHIESFNVDVTCEFAGALSARSLTRQLVIRAVELPGIRQALVTVFRLHFSLRLNAMYANCFSQDAP